MSYKVLLAANGLKLAKVSKILNEGKIHGITNILIMDNEEMPYHTKTLRRLLHRPLFFIELVLDLKEKIKALFRGLFFLPSSAKPKPQLC